MLNAFQHAVRDVRVGARFGKPRADDVAGGGNVEPKRLQRLNRFVAWAMVHQESGPRGTAFDVGVPTLGRLAEALRNALFDQRRGEPDGPSFGWRFHFLAGRRRNLRALCARFGSTSLSRLTLGLDLDDGRSLFFCQRRFRFVARQFRGCDRRCGPRLFQFQVAGGGRGCQRHRFGLVRVLADEKRADANRENQRSTQGGRDQHL